MSATAHDTTKGRLRLGEMLVEAGKVSDPDLETALALQRESGLRIGEQLVRMGFVSAHDMLRTLSRQLDCLLYDSDTLERTVEGITRDPETLNGLGLSAAFLRENRCVPVGLAGQNLYLAVADPLDEYVRESVEYACSRNVIRLLADAEAIADMIDTLTGGRQSSLGRIIEGMEESGGGGVREEDIEQLKDLASEAPVVRMVNLLINDAVARGASDIHFEPFEDEFKVRFRIDGVLEDVESPPKRLQPAVISRLKIMSGLNIAERRLPQDGRIRQRIAGREIDFRVSTLPTAHGESVVLRILDRAKAVVDLQQLGFPPDVLERFYNLIYQPHGIILVTGPTGSGKTTTLYGALERINTVEKKIITIEDPVEYQIKGINQIQVNARIGLTFANGLRSIVRQDPDVIMIGEIRDAETAEIAIQSALTGHLVFSTLHTNDAPTAVGRLQEMGMEDYLIASTVLGVLAQRLVRILCPHCRREAEITAAARAALGNELPAEVRHAYEPAGCGECRDTGYQGRKGIFELLMIADEVREQILAKADASKIRRVGRNHGLRTLREDGLAKVRDGLTSISEVLRVAAD